MTLTEQSDGWYKYEQSDGSISIRETEDGFEFRDKFTMMDLAGHSNVGGAEIGELVENAIVEWREMQ